MDTTMLNMRNLFEQLVRRVEILSEGNELRKSFWAGLWEKKKQISDLGFLHSQAKLFFILSYLKKKNNGQLFVIKASWTWILNGHFFFSCGYF